MNKIIIEPLQPVTFATPLKMQNGKIDTIIELPSGDLVFVDSTSFDVDEIVSWYNFSNIKD